MLKVPRKILSIAIPEKTKTAPEERGRNKAMTRNAEPAARFVIGPAMLIIPFLRLSTAPDICTAPGAAKRNPAMDVKRAIKSPMFQTLYSAQHPYLCAVNLCPISCKKNPNITAPAAVRKARKTEVR